MTLVTPNRSVGPPTPGSSTNLSTSSTGTVASIASTGTVASIGSATTATTATAASERGAVVEIAGLSLRIPIRRTALPPSPGSADQTDRHTVPRRRWARRPEQRTGSVHAATDVDLQLRSGRVHALVGESGCGKSVLASTLVGLLPPGTHAGGSPGVVTIDGIDVSAALSDPQDRVWSRLRGRVVGLVAQSSATYLTPTRTVGAQLAETIDALAGPQDPHELLARVGLAPSVLRAYPHELSGGMAGRAALAFALAGAPRVIVADEPTASLDPDLTDLVLRLLRQAADDGAAVLLITHDLAALRSSGVADDVSVMYAGHLLESGPAMRVLEDPAHPYTAALLDALPERGLRPMAGMPPSLVDLDPTAAFADLAERLRLRPTPPGGNA